MKTVLVASLILLFSFAASADNAPAPDNAALAQKIVSRLKQGETWNMLTYWRFDYGRGDEQILAVVVRDGQRYTILYTRVNDTEDLAIGARPNGTYSVKEKVSFETDLAGQAVSGYAWAFVDGEYRPVLEFNSRKGADLRSIWQREADVALPAIADVLASD